VKSDEKAIMREIYAHGPVEAALTVYEDLLSYKRGKLNIPFVIFVHGRRLTTRA